jgi:hypothetical protein
MRLFRTFLISSAIFAGFASSPAWASKELNLARDGASDPGATALILNDRQAHGYESSTITWLLYITDLSLPADKQSPVKLYSSWSNLASKYARVSAGSYKLQVKCEKAGAFGASMSQDREITIEAKPGKAYVVSCNGVGARAGVPTFEEVDPGTLKH